MGALCSCYDRQGASTTVVLNLGAFGRFDDLFRRVTKNTRKHRYLYCNESRKIGHRDSREAGDRNFQVSMCTPES